MFWRVTTRKIATGETKDRIESLLLWRQISMIGCIQHDMIALGEPVFIRYGLIPVTLLAWSLLFSGTKFEYIVAAKPSYGWIPCLWNSSCLTLRSRSPCASWAPSLHRGLVRGSFPAPHHHDPNKTLPNFQIWVMVVFLSPNTAGERLRDQRFLRAGVRLRYQRIQTLRRPCYRLLRHRSML